MELLYARPDVLVSTDWAITHLGNPKLRFVEVDVDSSSYEQGHLPGTVNFSLQTDLSAPVRRDIPSAAAFEELLSSAGIHRNTRVVLYGDCNNCFAAFAFWLLKYYGHEDACIIDGGRTKLIAESRPLTTEVPDHLRTRYRVLETHPQLRIFSAAVLQIAQDGGANLVDVRSRSEYTGAIIAPPGSGETAQRGGHIPRAVNVPWDQAVNEDGTFKSYEDLAQIYGAKGLNTMKETVTYCRIGERAAHSWFVLKYLLGFKNVRNYDGSWTEYGNMINVPIEKTIFADIPN